MRGARISLQYSDAIGLGRFDEKSGSSGERHQVPITADEKLGFPIQSQVEEGRIVGVGHTVRSRAPL
jgi:hypothetical protein